ncbi:retrovirus-related Pol polyprotein from transposon 297 [Trichonephila clavipes]|nr:retrovirus-related Pol polyprotein from transposon 297 [Trichonephila clavipes]
MQLVPVISEVFSKLNVDAVGPLPTTPTGNKTDMCMSSKYPDAVPMPDIASTTVVEALFQIFSRMGFPKEIQTDQGTSFTSILTSVFFENFGINVVRSSVYHPQSNPVERFHRTLKRILRVICIESSPEWKKQLPAALFALRTITYESTGFTPAELVHGKNLRTPITLLYENWMGTTEEVTPVVEYVFQLINRLKSCQELAIEKMEETKIKRKAWYDKNAIKREFSEGDLVLVLKMNRPNKLSVCSGKDREK